MESFKNINHAVQFLPDKMKKNGLFESERMFCDLYCFEPGQTQAVHKHDGSDKVYFVIQGKGLFQLGDEEFELPENHVIMAPSGKSHGVRNPGPDRLVLLVFMAPRPAH